AVSPLPGPLGLWSMQRITDQIRKVGEQAIHAQGACKPARQGRKTIEARGQLIGTEGIGMHDHPRGVRPATQPRGNRVTVDVSEAVELAQWRAYPVGVARRLAKPLRRLQVLIIRSLV